MEERKEGWYWVKLHDSDGWIPWEWLGAISTLRAKWYNNEQPIEIGPRIRTPDEAEGS